MNKGKSLVRAGFFHVFGSSTINQIISFAYSIFIVRVISKSDYGVYVSAMNAYSMLVLFSGFGIASALLQLGSEHANHTEKARSYFSFSNRFGLTVNAIISFIVLLAGLFFPLPIQGSNQLLALMALLPILQIIRDLQIINLRVNLRNRAFGYANTTNVVLTSVFTILGAWLFSAEGIIFGQYLVVIIMLMVLTLIMKAPFPVSGSALSRKERKDLLQVAGISAFNNALTQLLGLLGTLVLSLAVKDETMIASYKVASTVPFALNFIPASLMMFAYPYFARHKSDRQWTVQNYRLITIVIGLMNALIVLGGVLLAEPIIIIVFGSNYLDAVLPFRILMLSYFFTGTLHYIAGNLLVTQRKLKFNLLIGVLGSVSSTLLNVLLVPGLLSVGAALAQLLTSVLLGVLATLYYIRVIKKIPDRTIGQ